MPTNRFTRNILKTMVGEERAQNAFASISLGAIPNADSLNKINGKGSQGYIRTAQSLNEIGSYFANRLEGIKNKIEKGQAKIEAKKKDGKTGIEAFIVEDSDESNESGDSFEAAHEQGSKSMANTDASDPSKLIDLELVNLLRYCADLQEKKTTDEYEDEIMMKSLQLGSKTKDKLLIFDMDETLIAAKFNDSIPAGFETTFKFPFKDTEISVRMRPYVLDSLEKLATLYELVVFTAGEQEYADNILDHIDPEKRIFKKRLYRQDCVLLDGFYIKDLEIILDRNRKDMIIVDNSILSFAFDLDNGVPINSFIGNEEDDRELLYLYSFLEEAASVEDVRVNIRDSFKLSYLQSTILNVKQEN